MTRDIVQGAKPDQCAQQHDDRGDEENPVAPDRIGAVGATSRRAERL